MTLEELAGEFYAERVSAGLLLDETETLACAVSASRYYAAYGTIKSLSKSDVLQGAPIPGKPLPLPLDPEPDVLAALPAKNLGFVTGDTDISMGEWAIIKPLFLLYVERDNATRLEASRGLGVDVFGRSVSEIAQEIERMEGETLPAKCFRHVVIEV
jgi:hypothetical protein